jgi:hypothetical protein
VETRTGTLEFKDGVPSKATIDKMYDQIDFTHAGDLLLFTDWRGDPDELLAGPATEVSRVLCAAATRGVVVTYGGQPVTIITTDFGVRR